MNIEKGQSLLMSKILQSLSEGVITGNAALDQVATLDPETQLGKILTELMIMVTNHNLFSPYMGFTREPGLIHVFFSRSADKHNLDGLVDAMQNGILTEPDYPNIQARVFKKSVEGGEAGDEIYVVELRFHEEDEEIPSEVTLDGELNVNKEDDESKTKETDAGDEDDNEEQNDED